MEIRQDLIERFATFAKAHGLSEREFCIRAAGNPKLMLRLRKGLSVTLANIEEMERFMSTHTPSSEAAE